MDTLQFGVSNLALSNCPFQALGITFFLGPPLTFHFVFPFFPFFLPLLYPNITLFIYFFLLFSFFTSFSAVLHSLTVLFLSLYYYLLPDGFTFSFCFMNFIQASLLLFSFCFIFTSVHISYFRLHCPIGTSLQAPPFSFSRTQNSY